MVRLHGAARRQVSSLSRNDVPDRLDNYSPGVNRQNG